MGYSIDPKTMIDKCLSYTNKAGIKIDLSNPNSIQEKLMWLNIYDQNPLKTKCADKILLHDYCKEILGIDICIPIIKIYNKPEDINYDELPEQFVIKCNHGYAMNIIIKNKSDINRSDINNKLNKWINTDFSFAAGFEAHYHDIDKKIYIEEYKNDGHDDLIDYKFLCFNGKPTYCQIIGNRNNNNRFLNYYDMDFNYVNFSRKDFKSNKNIICDKPNNYFLMQIYAEKLSRNFKFVRVDFYEIDNKIYLGELTFTPGAMGFDYEKPDDKYKMGKLLVL